MTHTVFFDSDAHLENVRGVMSDVAALSEASDVVYRFKDEPIVTSRMMTVMNRIGYAESTKRLIIGMFRDACSRVDVICGDFAYVTTAFVITLCDDIVMRLIAGDDVKSIESEIDEGVADMRSILSSVAIRADVEDMELIVRKISQSVPAAEIAVEALKLAGVTGRIHARKTVGASTSKIELTGGYAFDLEPVITLNSVEPWKRRNVRCLIIDGIIESVSEIDGLLQRCHSSGAPMIMLTRGYGAEVASTIGANRLRKTLDVHPLMVPFDARKANGLKDIAVIAGCDVVSSLKGELIETIAYDELPVLDTVSIVGGKLTITNPRSSLRVSHHVEWLQKQRDDVYEDAIRDVYDERIRSLTGTRVDVSIGGSPRESQALAEQVDSSLRMAKSVMSHGSVNLYGLTLKLSRLRGSNETIIDHAMHEMIDAAKRYTGINNAVYDDVPTLALALALREGATYAKRVCLAAGVIVNAE